MGFWHTVSMKISTLSLLFLFAMGGTAAAQCAPDHGDVNGDGLINLLDMSCATQLLLAEVLDQEEPPVSCAPGGLASLDQNCDGEGNLVDVAIIVHVALEQTLPVEVDATGDGCPNACDSSPTQVGAALPLWSLPDQQPLSPLFGVNHGPKDGTGVRVIALLDGG